MTMKHKGNRDDQRQDRDKRPSNSRSDRKPDRNGRPSNARSDRKPFRSESTRSDRYTHPTAEAGRDLSEEREDQDRIEGRNSVWEALQSERDFHKVWIAKSEGGTQTDPFLKRIAAQAKQKKVPVVEVPRSALDQMSCTHNHQGVIAQVAAHEYADPDLLLADLKEKNITPFFIMLDGLKDGYNLGSILRIADAAGVHGVIIPRHRSIGLDALVSKASAGAIEHVPVIRTVNLAQMVLRLKEEGFWVAGTDAGGTIHYKKADYQGPLLIVIGGEGEGISKNLLDKCDFILSIPMSGKVNSLNAAVAAGIVIFEAQFARNGVQSSVGGGHKPLIDTE